MGEFRIAKLIKARLLEILGESQEALTELNNPVLIVKNDTILQAINLWKTQVYYSLQNYDSSINYANKYLSNFFKMDKYSTLSILQLKAMNLRELGKYKEALVSINEAIKKDNTNSIPSLYATKGIIYYKIQDYSDALNEFIKATLLDEKDGESFYYRAMCYKNLNQKNKACENFLKAVKLGNKDALDAYPVYCK